MPKVSSLPFGNGGAFVSPPCDAKTQNFIGELFPHDPYWRFGAIFEADRNARKLRAENERRQADFFARAGKPVAA